MLRASENFRKKNFKTSENFGQRIKFLKRNPLAEKRYDIKVNSEFSQNVMMNRYMMKTANFNTLNSIPDYANSMSEVILKHKRAA